MMRMIGRTGLETMRRVAAATVMTVGLAGAAWAADPVKDAAPAATPVATAAAVATPDEAAANEQDPAAAANPVVEFFKQTEISGLTAVPVPAAAWLFGSGLIGLAGVARRRTS